MSSVGSNNGFDCISKSPLLLQNLDNVPSHLLPQLQACAARVGYIDGSYKRNGSDSLPDDLMMPEDLPRSKSLLERHGVALTDCGIPPTLRDGYHKTWLAESQPFGAQALGESVVEHSVTGQQAASPPSSHSPPEAITQSPDETSQRKPKKHWSSAQRRRVPHHVIERRYRDNLNGQIDKLRTCIPSLANERCSSTSDVEDDPMPVKCPSKAAVIVSAQAYIKELEEQQERLQSNARALQEQVSGLQKLVRCDDCSVVKYFNSLQLNGSLTVQ